MDYFILAFIAFVVGFKISELIHVTSFKKILEDLNVTSDQLRGILTKNGVDTKDLPQETSTKTQIEIKVETVQGQLFAYDLHKDTFIAQGRDGDELLERILAKFPTNVRVICDVDHGGALISEAAQRLAQKS